jgi:hypothetical protein
MKKLVVMLLTAVIAVSAVTGCGTSGNQPEESTAGPESGAADEGEAVPEETEADHTEVSETERAAEEEIISEGTVYNVFCLGEDFKNRVQDYYPEYVITGEDAGMIGETKVQWHLYTDAQEYREALDEKLEAQADAEGMEAMLSLLHSIDPEAAARLHLKDRKRIIRALEVYYETGETITDHNRKTQAIPPKDTPLWLGLDFDPRAALYDRIDRRVDLMLEAGLVEEIQHLLSQGIPARCTAMQAIGYKEFLAYRSGNCSLTDAVAQVQQASRNYAKRQLTWFRRNKAIHWLIREKGHTTSEILSMARQILRDSDN